MEMETDRNSHLSHIRDHLLAQVSPAVCQPSADTSPHTPFWMTPANRSCCYLRWDNTVREVTMPLTRLSTSETSKLLTHPHLCLSSHDRAPHPLGREEAEIQWELKEDHRCILINIFKKKKKGFDSQLSPPEWYFKVDVSYDVTSIFSH